MKHFDLTKLVDPPKTDSISGRGFGAGYSDKIKLLDLISHDENIEFTIDENYVKAINDSFIKGLFNEVFKKYKTISSIQSKININASEHFKTLFFKNWKILENIYNV